MGQEGAVLTTFSQTCCGQYEIDQDLVRLANRSHQTKYRSGCC